MNIKREQEIKDRWSKDYITPLEALMHGKEDVEYLLKEIEQLRAPKDEWTDSIRGETEL